MLSSWLRSRRVRQRSTLRSLAVEALEDRLVPSSYTVTNTGDLDSSGNPIPGSLRQAILDANSNPGADTITFSIGSGPATIKPDKVLPTLTDAVTIDGTTQPGYGGTPLIDLEGATSGQAGYDGLTITAANCVIKGLVINAFNNGITIQGSAATGNQVNDCYIGTNASGTAARANGGQGVEIIDGASDNSLADDVLSGNQDNGVFIGTPRRSGNHPTSSGNVVQGCLIGTTASGLAPLMNDHRGIFINQSSDNTILGNVVSCNGVLSGSGFSGIVIANQNADGNLVEGNDIGVDKNGNATAGMANSAVGIRCGTDADDNSILGNVIGPNGRYNVADQDDSVAIDNWDGFGSFTGKAGVGNSVLDNRIYENPSGNNAIFLYHGGNDGLAAPVLASVFTSGGGTTVAGSLSGTANTPFLVELFASATASPAQGQVFLGRLTQLVTTGGNGQASFTAVLQGVSVPAGDVVTATATQVLDPNTTPLVTGDTSGYSGAIGVQSGGPGNVQLSFNPPSGVEGQPLTLTAGNFSDNDTAIPHAVSIDWGDGSAPTTVSLDAGVTTFAPLDHVYNDEGLYTVTATVSDGLGDSSSQTAQVRVANAGPGNLYLWAGASSFTELQPGTLNGSFSDPGVQDTHTVTIDWGDGTAATTLSLAVGQLSFSAGHTYDAYQTGPPADPTPISVTVTDSETASVSAGISVTVQPLPVSVQVSDPGGVEDGNPYPATATVNGASSLEGVSPTIAYYDSNNVPLGGAPSGPGTYAAVATFPGSPDYTSGSASTSFIIKALTSLAVHVSEPQTYDQGVTFTAALSSDLGPLPGGEPVTFSEGNTPLGGGSLDPSGQVTFSTSPMQLSAGDHTITASYAGDSRFQGSSTDVDVAIQPADQSINFTPLPGPLTYGDKPITLHATASSGLPVSFQVVSGPAKVSGNTLTLTGAGTIEIEALQPGDGNYNPASADPVSAAVGKALLTVTADSPPPVVHGAALPALTVSKTGFVNGDGPSVLRGAPVTSTTASSSSDVGSYPITVSQGTLDADNYSFLFQNGTLTIGQALTHMSLNVSPASIAWGQEVTLTAQLNVASPGQGTPTRPLLFEDNGIVVGQATLDGSGPPTLTTSTLAIGSHTLTAVYEGDTNLADSTSAGVSLTVEPGETATGLTVSTTSTPALFGQAVMLLASVSASIPGLGTPTGQVLFEDAGTVLDRVTLDSNGQAAWPTSKLPVGPRLFTAVYVGDTNFSGSTSDGTGLTVGKDPAVTTATSSTAANTSVFGQPVTLTATVAASAPGSGTPTGSVMFLEGSTVLGTVTLDNNGVATLPVSTLAVGDHTITVVYLGDGNFSAGTPPTLTQTVTQDGSVVQLSLSRVKPVIGQRVTLTAKVTDLPPGAGTPTGTVTFQAGTTVVGTATLSNGVATLSTAQFPVGLGSITATYSGDANFLGSSRGRLVNVQKDPTTTRLTATTTHSARGKPVTLTATVLPIAPGAGTPTGTVTYKEGAKVLAKVKLVKGVAKLTLTLPRGKHSLTAVYSGDPDFLASQSTTVTVAVG